MKNNQGFMLAELIVVTTVMITFFMFVYSEFSDVYLDTINYSKYNNIQKLYAANEFKTFILSEIENSGDTDEYYLTETLNADAVTYIDVTNCTVFDNSDYCSTLITELDIESIYITKYNTVALQTYIASNNEPFDYEFKRYIKTLFYSSEAGVYDEVYIIMMKFTDGEYSYININSPEGFSGIIDDTVAPKITLNGNSTIEIGLGERFEDPGVTVIDNYDKELEVVRSGLVDTCEAGNYTITYTSTDSSGNVGTITRTVTVLPGYYLDFDGTNDYVDVPDLPNTINWNGGFSIEYTAKWNAYNNYSRIIDFANGAPSDNLMIYTSGTTTTLSFTIKSGTVGSTVGGTSVLDLNVNSWIVVYDQAMNGRIYKNSTQVGSGTFTYVINNVTRKINYIARSNYVADSYFKGRIYNIKIILANGDVVLWYKFNDGEGTTLTDYSGNGYNGTIYGATWNEYYSCP